MKILSIETSCDETAISILETKNNLRYSGDVSFRVLANNVASQVKIHAPYGGVYPMLAKREHIKNLPILLGKVLKKVKIIVRQDLTTKPVDLIAVTSGPGLEPALWAGIVFAKELAKKWSCPLVPVNHMEGHILSVFGKQKGKFIIQKIKFPTIALLISGGHTELVLVKENMNYKVIGETLDDAAGEAFDKVARMLGLPYPGGPEISRLAEKIRTRTSLNALAQEYPASQRHHSQKHISSVENPGIGKQRSQGVRSATGARLQQFSSRKIAYPENVGFSLPRPMLHSKNFDFSFSGLKTAVLYLIKKIGKLDEKIKAKIAMEFENAVIETLIHKTQKAVEKYKIKTLIVAGGVSANKYLRKEIKKNIKIKILFPEKGLATDNSIMIGIAGYLQYIKNKGKVKRIRNIKATGNLRL